jgi:tetratricopeptide (TPR) repeat protein
VLRRDLEAAIEAYRAAADIAPSRALPHTSLGGVLLRLGHLEEALVEYAMAVARAPHDEGALLGQAEALTVVGQRVDAALALDHVSEIQEAAGRLPEAADTLRRALELEDAPERARRQRGLMREIRLSAGDAAAEQLLARALRLRDEPARNELETAQSAIATAVIGGPSVENPMVASAISNEGPANSMAPAETLWRPAQAVESVVADAPEEAVTPATVEAAAAAGPEPAEVAVARPVGESEWPKENRAPQAAEPAAWREPAVWREPQAESAARPAAVAEPAAAEPVPEAEPVAVAAQQNEVSAVGVMEGASDPTMVTETLDGMQHQPTGDELMAAAEAADVAGDNETMRSLLVGTARAYAREGRLEAGLDAAHRLLQRDPGDVDAHLVLVELYVARDWNVLAAEKLTLLGRLAELNDDLETRQRLCEAASRDFPNDERLGALCA